MFPALIAAAALAPLAPAVPLSPADADDLHCLAYLSVAAGKVDGSMRARVDAGALYYFGRIEGRSPKLDIAKALDAILNAPDYGAATYQADKARCHAQLTPLATEFKAWEQRYHAAEQSSDDGAQTGEHDQGQ